MFRRKSKYSLSLVTVFVVFALALVIGSSQVVFAAKKYIIGAPALSTVSDWNLFCSKGIEDMAEELGMDCIVTDANMDYSKQNQDAETMIRRHVDALVLPGGGAPAFLSTVNAAAKANIPIISVEVLLEGPTVKTEVASNQFLVGFYPTNYLLDRINRNGKVAVFYQPGFTSIERRYKAFQVVKNEYTGIEVVVEHPYGEADFVNYAMAAVESILKAHPDLKGIWCCWDGPGTGAAKAVCAAGRKDIVVTGIDGNRMALELLRDPDSCLAATLCQDGYEQGRVGARLTLQVLQGKEIPRYITLPNFLATKENVSEIPEGMVWTEASEFGWDEDVIKVWEEVNGKSLPPLNEQHWLY